MNAKRQGDFEREILSFANSHEFKTFWLAVVLSSDMEKGLGKEEAAGLKGEMKRRLGAKLERRWEKRGIRAKHDDPDVLFTLDFYRNRLVTKIKPLYIYGRYLKFSREIPQSKWPCRKCHGTGCGYCGGKGAMYEETVEGLIAEPLLAATGAKATKMHAVGREDIDARMLGSGRPFVLELADPKKRKISLAEFEKEINRKNKDKVGVGGLRFVGKDAVEEVKSAQPAKTYLIKVRCGKSIRKCGIQKLLRLRGKEIRQQTPERVLHRRADLERRRKILGVKVEQTDKNVLELTIKAQAGTYVKELVTGDGGRTRPSVSGILGCSCKPLELDVMDVDFALGE